MLNSLANTDGGRSLSRRNRSRRRTRRTRGGKSDSIILKGHEVVFNIFVSSPNTVNAPIAGNTTYYDVKPAALMDRVGYAAAIYSRYRIKNIRLRYKTSSATTTRGALAIGFLDDAAESNFTGNILTFDQIINLRCSQDDSLWKDFTVNWTPLDPKKWYYTNTSASDNRFSSPCTIFAAFDLTAISGTAATYLGSCRIDYAIEFMGATPYVLTSLRVADPTPGCIPAPSVDVNSDKEEAPPVSTSTLRVPGHHFLAPDERSQRDPKQLFAVLPRGR